MRNVLGFRGCIFYMLFKDRSTCRMARRMINFRARKIDEKMLTFLESPRSNAAGNLLLFNNSVRTAKKTRHFTITKINWLTLFKEAVYSENHTKHINTKCRLVDCKAGGAYIYH
jgi:hypothetical protein